MGKKVRGQKIDYRKQKKRKWRIQLKIPKFLIPKDEPIVPRPFTLIDYTGGIVVFFICWTVYLHTLTPTIGFQDSGDMVTAAYVLGIPHPTGYPLYCLLGKLWMTILPIGNIAYRMNLASALCASLSCMMVYFIILKVGSGKWEVGSNKGSNKEGKNFSLLISHLSLIIPAIVGALMLAFATTFWEQAVIAEKYTLNALFATLLIFILLKWQEAMSTEHGAESREQKTPGSILNAQRLLYLFSFTLGLSFTHHMQTIYLVPASIFFIIAICWKYKDFSLLTLHSSLKLLCLFILPLFLYLYLPIRASANPPYCYGNPETLESFIGHISGGEYKLRYISMVSAHDFLKRMQEHINFFPYQFTPYLVWIGIISIFTFLKRKLFLVFFCVIVITNIIFAIQYNIPNIKDYYIISYLIFSVLLGLGAREVIVKGIYPICGKKIKLHILYIFILFLPILSFSIHYQDNNYNNYYLAYDYNRNILKPLKEKALSILALGYDEVVFPSAYIQWVENERSDVAIIIYAALEEKSYIDLLKRNYPHVVIDFSSQKREKEMTAEILEKIKIERLNNLITNNIDNYSIYTRNQELFSNYQLIPGNVLFRVLKRGVTLDKMCEEFKDVNLNLRGIHKGKINGKYPSTLVEKSIIENYAFAYTMAGQFYYYIKKYDKAIISIKKALEINPNSQQDHYFYNIFLKECKYKNKN